MAQFSIQLLASSALPDKMRIGPPLPTFLGQRTTERRVAAARGFHHWIALPAFVGDIRREGDGSGTILFPGREA